MSGLSPIGSKRVAVISAGVIGSVHVDSEIRHLDPADLDVIEFLGRVEARTWDRASQLALVASRLASAGLHPISPDDCGIVLGTTYGNMCSTEAYFSRYLARGPRMVSPLQFTQAGTGMPASMVAMELGWRGHHLTVSQGGSSGVWAMFLAVQAILTGRAHRILTGAVDAVSRVSTWCEDQPSEGAAMIVLDADSHATADPPRIAGAAMGENIGQAARAALDVAGLTAGHRSEAITVPGVQGSVPGVVHLIDLAYSAVRTTVWTYAEEPGPSFAFVLTRDLN